MADEPQGRINLSAKVAALVTDTQLAFNVGASAGVREGDVVHVIRDVQVDAPTRREQLGNLFDSIRLRLHR